MMSSNDDTRKGLKPFNATAPSSIPGPRTVYDFDVVRARRIEILDGQGRVRVALYAEDGLPYSTRGNAIMDDESMGLASAKNGTDLAGIVAIDALGAPVARMENQGLRGMLELEERDIVDPNHSRRASIYYGDLFVDDDEPLNARLLAVEDRLNMGGASIDEAGQASELGATPSIEERLRCVTERLDSAMSLGGFSQDARVRYLGQVVSKLEAERGIETIEPTPLESEREEIDRLEARIRNLDPQAFEAPAMIESADDMARAMIVMMTDNKRLAERVAELEFAATDTDLEAGGSQS